MPKLRVVASGICRGSGGFGRGWRGIFGLRWSRKTGVPEFSDFGMPENEGPCRGSRCLLSGVKQTYQEHGSNVGS